MSAAAIIQPTEVTALMLAQLGGKARSLYDLGQLDSGRVPAWFAVAAEVFADAVAAAGIEAAITAALARLSDAGPAREAVQACVAELAPLLAQLRAPAEVAAAVATAYDALGADYVAVRSSALDEDGVERSFAGCLDTSLYVRGAEDVVAAIVRCWCSAFSERSLAYRAAHGALAEPIRVAVVVQRMVAGAVSGVLFSADPSTGARDRAIVTSTWGLGEGVVSGRLACDTFTIDRASMTVIDRDVVEKAMAIVHDGAAGQGTCEVEVELGRQSSPSLDDHMLSQLAVLGWKIEDAYGTPVDIEWTWSEDGPWILQARPITTGVGNAAPTGGTKRLWDNSNIIESYSGVTSPLTYSFALRAYSIVYRQAFEVLGVPEAELNRNQRTFDQMIGLLRGRVYYNLESWYVALQLLPGYKFNAEFMEQMMGVGEKSEFGPARPPRASAARRYLVELPKLAASLTQLTTRFARSEKMVDAFFENFTEAYGDFEALELGELGLDDLVSTYLEAEVRILQRWQAPIVNDILAMIFFGALRKALTAWGFEDAALHNDLLCGEGGLESTEPTRTLLTLMVDVRRDEALCELLAAATPEEICTAVEQIPRFGWLKTRIADHVARYGDRCVDELKLEEPTLRDDPTFLYAALKGYLSAPPVTVEDMEVRERRIRDQAETAVRAKLRNPARRKLFEWLLTRTRQHVKNRENLRFARTRAFGLVRRLAVAMGERLVAAGRLDAVHDVFYLEVGELVAFSRGTATTTDLRGLAAVRRREYAGYRASDNPPERFWTEGPVYLDPALTAARNPEAAGAGPATAGTVLVGIGASPGVVRAAARLVTDPRNAAISGEVLVANRTDPGWVPLFPSAKAVVVERGSVLSHSAIVAREFGIPCVVGIRDAMSRLRDGQAIEVDGSAGTVTVLED
ncbi:MAG TPA: PEP/pyruvate-binding domain-containing protein [Kofleriaceae bacterium]|nr:PEP/pyruvate-binding domain-containing protein [Kofleriaceae bacterium]